MISHPSCSENNNIFNYDYKKEYIYYAFIYDMTDCLSRLFLSIKNDNIDSIGLLLISFYGRKGRNLVVKNLQTKTQ